MNKFALSERLQILELVSSETMREEFEWVVKQQELKIIVRNGVLLRNRELMWYALFLILLNFEPYVNFTVVKLVTGKVFQDAHILSYGK